MNPTLQSIPATEGARKVAPGEGERFDVAGAHLTWKVKGEDSGYAFSICEQTLAPGEACRCTVTRPRRSSTFSQDRPISFVLWMGGRIGFVVRLDRL